VRLDRDILYVLRRADPGQHFAGARRLGGAARQVHRFGRSGVGPQAQHIAERAGACVGAVVVTGHAARDPLALEFDAAQPAQRPLVCLDLDLPLAGGGEVSQGASGTARRLLATRVDAMRRRLEDLDELTEASSAMVFDDAVFDPLADVRSG
jgi:hypothetical protein